MDVAGVSGEQDALFDLAQLADGRVAFLGAKGTVADSGFIVAGMVTEPGGNDDAFAVKCSRKPGVLALSRRAGTVMGRGRGRFSITMPPHAGGSVHMRLFDLHGREAANFRKDMPGSGTVEFEGSSRAVSAGVYYWRTESPGEALQGTLPP